MSDFDFFILLAVAFIAVEITAAFGLLDDEDQAGDAASDS